MHSEKSFCHQPRPLASSQQDLMPARYSLWVQFLSIAAFSLAFGGWLNETWLMWFENPIWLNRYTEYAIIFSFGIWRIYAEKNSYTRRRLIILVAMVTGFWWFIPWLMPFSEPYVGYLWGQPVFPALHVPGTITFFIILAAVFLFGRRIICGFNCPCVGIRETVGFAFRDRTLRSELSWMLRHSKWFFFAYYIGIMVVTQFPPNSWTVSFVGGFYLLVALSYFGSFFLAPLVGNRFYCRYLCPYGATFGLLNHAGFYSIEMQKDQCNDCQRCEQVCDMGIPVWRQGKKSGRITAIEDCMGCGRCVVSCPTDALEIKDFRNWLKPSLRQNASYLLKTTKTIQIDRATTAQRPVTERKQDWEEIHLETDLLSIQQQASRCMDCGVAGCISGCPLHNRIPEWLEQLAAGNIQQAAQIAQSTNNFPEICGTLCPQERLCEASCTKNSEPGGAVTIGQIERYIINQSSLSDIMPPPLKNKYALNKAVAIIGAGPAGLACAQQLNRAGCQVVVYDKQAAIGGLMQSAIPAFKLDKKLLQKRFEHLQQQGIKFELNRNINLSSMRHLLTHNHAIFIATGAQTSRALPLQKNSLSASKLSGVMDALEYLAQTAANPESNILNAEHLIVIGAGDSAIDCARSAIRQGTKRVSIIYRGAEDKMRCSSKEKQLALEEGVDFKFNYSALALEGNTSITGILFDHLGQQQHIACDALIIAIGQLTKPQNWMLELGIKTSAKGEIKINTLGQTSHPKIYAGGDNTHGPDLIVSAIAAGRLAAQGIIKNMQPLQKIKQRVFHTKLNTPDSESHGSTTARQNL